MKPLQRIVPALLVATLALSACNPFGNQTPGTPGPNPGTTPGGDGSGKVRISFAAGEWERAMYAPLIAEFQEQYPDIEIVFVSSDELMVPDESGNYDPTRSIVSGADTAAIGWLRPEDVTNGYMYDLKPLMDADANFDPADFYPGTLAAYARDDATYVLPRRMTVQILAYNRQLWDAAGLGAPGADWTWGDLLAAAERLASKRGSQVDVYGLLDPSGGFMSFTGLLSTTGNADVFSLPATDVRLDTPELQSALERVRDLARSGAVYAPGGQQEWVDPSELIVNNRAGIWISDMLYPREDLPEPSFEIGYMPIPTLPYGFNYAGGVEGFIISAGTRYPDEAWRWIEFLSRQEISQPGGDFEPPAGVITQIPARVSLAEATGYWDTVPAGAADAIRTTLQNLPPVPERSPDYMAVGALYPVFEQVLLNNVDPQRALRDAQRQLEEQLAQVILTPSPTPNTEPIVVATPQPNTAPEGSVAINFGFSGYSPGEIRRLTQRFMQDNPDVFVRLTNTDVFTQSTGLADVARQTDCFSNWQLPTEDDASALLDLRPLFDADRSFPIDDYPAALLAVFTRDDALLGLPYAANYRVLRYNQDLFDQAGVEYPDGSWTLDDFLGAAQALTRGDGDRRQYGYASAGGQIEDLLFFVGQNGGRLLTGSGENVRPNYTDPGVVRGVQYYVDLLRTYDVTPYEGIEGYRRDQSNWTDVYTLMSEGRLGMWFDYGYGFGPVGPGGQEPRLGVAPLPVGDAGLTGADISTRGMYISATTEQPQACWELIKYLSADTSLLQGSIPARLSIADSPAFQDQADPALVQIYAAYRDVLQREPGASGGTSPNVIWGTPIEYYWFFQAVDRAIQGEDVQQELAEAQRITTAYLDCLNQGNKEQPWVCTVQVDPEYEGYITPPTDEGPIGRPVG